MKRSKTFAKVVYYLFTISLGILMCFFLPYLFMYDGESMNMIEEALEEGRPADSMALVGGYFKSEPIFAQDFPGGGSIVLFESATLYDKKYGEGEDAKTKFRLHKSYAGFVYGVDGIYNTRQEQNNQTILKIVTDSGEVDFDLLNTDLNNDGTMDAISTLIKNGFFLIDLPEDKLAELSVSSMTALKFIDKDGNVFAEATLPQDNFGAGKLFDTQFFNDVESTIAKYNEIIDFEVNNADDADYDAKLEAMAKELSTLDAELIGKGYSKSTTSIARSRADKLATITIVFYFVGILIIGDLLVGGRYTIKAGKWILTKVFKVDFEKLAEKRKSKKQAAKAEVADFGNDYFCQVVFELDAESRAGVDDEIKISYASETQNVTFTLNRSNGFVDRQRVQKDVLNLTEVESLNSNNYNEIPDLLIVEGFNKSVIIKTMMQEE